MTLFIKGRVLTLGSDQKMAVNKLEQDEAQRAAN